MEQYRSLEHELSKREIEVVSLQNSLENASKHMNEYQKIASSMENELMRFKEEKEKELKELKLALIEKTTEITKIKEAENEKEKQFSTSTSLIQEQEISLKKQADEIQILTNQVEELKRLLDAEKTSCDTMTLNYRNEFQKHSEDLKKWKEKEDSYMNEQKKVIEMKKMLEQKEQNVQVQVQQNEEQVKVE